MPVAGKYSAVYLSSVCMNTCVNPLRYAVGETLYEIVVHTVPHPNRFSVHLFDVRHLVQLVFHETPDGRDWVEAGAVACPL